jgi:hypothetical protein
MSEPPFPPPITAYSSVQVEAPRTGLATGALVLGIISIPTLCVCVGPLLGLVAAILGVVALVRAGGDPTRYGGKGRAVGGIITGVIGILLIIPAGVLGFMFGRTSAGPMMTVQAVGVALQSYVTAYDAYPPDLDTLVKTTGVQAGPFADPNNPVAGVSYFVGINRDDPPGWLVAYVKTNVMGQPMFAVAYADGSADMLEAAEFNQTLATFQQEYQADRGSPPTLLKAPEKDKQP